MPKEKSSPLAIVIQVELPICTGLLTFIVDPFPI